MVVEGLPVCRDCNASTTEGGELYGAVEDRCIEGVVLRRLSPDICAGWSGELEVSWKGGWEVSLSRWPIGIFPGHGS